MSKRVIIVLTLLIVLMPGVLFADLSQRVPQQASDPGMDARSVVRIHITARDDMARILELDDLDIAAGRRGEWVDLVIHPDRLDALRRMGFTVEVRIPDCAEHLNQTMDRDRYNFGDYFTYSEMTAELDALHTAYPSITTARYSIGTSLEGNDLWVMKVSDDPGIDDPDEKKVLYNGVTHAREPIGCTLCLEMIRYLCENYGTDPYVTDLVDNSQAYFLPVINPDGYIYNESDSSGMWRKNRRNNGDGTYGVDINRNWGYQWGFDNSGSSPYTSDPDYRGPSAFSEPETQAVRDFFIAEEFVISWDCHSYGDIFLYPFGYDNIYTPDHDIFVNMADLYTEGQPSPYDAGTPWELLYPVNGGSFDWEYGEQTAKAKCLSVSPEVGAYFWDESNIPTHISENLPGMLQLLELAANPMVAYQGYTIADGGNGRLDPGETTDMMVTLANVGLSDLTNVQMTLSESDPYITFLDGSAGFGNLTGGGTVENSADPFVVQADAGAPLGHPVTVTMDITGDGGYSDSDTFTLVVGQPSILIVDDDDGDGYESYFQNALTNVGRSADSWQITASGSPPALTLAQYDGVIWFTGDDYTSTLSSTDQSNLAAYLDAGGNLFISGQDIGYDIGSSAFYTNYLKATYVTDDSGDTGLLGVAGDLMGDGLDLTISGGDGANNQNYPSEISATGGSVACWTYNGTDVAAVRYEGTYKLVYLAFGFEAISNQADRDEVMQRAFDWFMPVSPPTDTVGVALSCVPGSGTLPFTSQFTVDLINLTGESRRAAAKINAVVAGGTVYNNWKSGWTNLSAFETFTTDWNQNLPALGSLVGDNVFTIEGEDVTPTPFNQPPYAPAGDTDTAQCTVTGVSP